MELPGKRAGKYTLVSMPKVGPSPVPSIVTCLGRRQSHYSERFYTVKILTIKDPDNETYDERQGKMLLHTEYALLSLLKKQEGVVHSYDFFKDEADEESDTYGPLGKIEYTGKTVTRYCLVLDCLVAHDYNNKNNSLINLQHYVIKEKKLTEKEALSIFIHIVKTVADLHQLNIVHRDLKLGNMVLNKTTSAVTITNFCLGKHLMGDEDVLKDQRGSPAYISPEVLSGQPYKGKPSDVWALGVVLFTMLYGQFPFYDQVPHELFKKIKSVQYDIPDDRRVSSKTKDILRKMLTLNPSTRLTAQQLFRTLQEIVSQWHDKRPPNEDQIVPEKVLRASQGPARPSVIQRHDSRTVSDIERFLFSMDREEHAACLSESSSLVPSGDSSNTMVGMKRKGPPIRRLSEDARPLSNIEIDMYRSKRVLHTPAPPPSTSNILSATAKHNDYQRKLLEFRLRTHSKTPYARGSSQAEQRSRALGRGVPMTPTIAPTTLSLPPAATPLPRATNPFTHLRTDGGHSHGHSVSPSANPLRNQATPNTSQLNTDERRLQRLLSSRSETTSSLPSDEGHL
ncbi:serine/threonine-protein kinase 40-like [Watersipora subatra]|uniref:serine/threonine-protein kinase 40-like n=1 Tax=Watersipora subatra TaxID=2589382 RepID=UPI00355B5EEF